jgi:hypothetical protein
MKTNIHLQSWLRRAAVLLITLAGCLPIVAQEEEIEGGEAFYIYQNDGHFDGFFYDQVKQIRYSRLDTLGIEHDRYVSQEIVTEDSVYRIMLTAIDSVSYVQPEIRYAKETRFMADEGMMAYYLSISKPFDDRFLLRFSGSMPAALQPKVGDVLCCPKLKDYEEAFVGKVKKVHSEGGEIQVECGYIEDLSEVFEQFVTVEQIRQKQTENGVRFSRRIAGLERPTRAEGNWEDITLFNVTSHLEGNLDLFSDNTKLILGADLSFAAVANAVYKIKGWRDFYLKTEVKPQVGLNFNVAIDGQIGGTPISLKSLPGVGDLLSKVSRIPFPAVCPILYLDVVPEPFIRGEAHLNFALNTGPEVKAMGLGIELKSEYPYIVPSASLLATPIIPAAVFLPSELDGKFELSAEINGMAQIGIKSPIKLGTMDWLKWVADAETESTLYAGPKLDGKFPLSTQMLSNTIFENLEEAELNFTALSCDLEFSAKGSILGWDGEAKKTFNYSIFKYPMKAFPVIDIDNIKVDIYGERKNNVRVSYGTKGNVFFPQTLGVGIYTKADEKDNEYRKLYKKDFRSQGYFMNTFNNVELTFEDLEAGEYLVCPIIKPSFPIIPTDDDGLIPAYKGANYADDYDKQKRKFTITMQELVLTPSEIQAEEEGGEFGVDVQTGFDTPIIPESLEKWINAEIITGSDKSNTLKLTVDENQTDAFRTGLVFVRQQISDNEVAEKTVTVKQYGGLELSKSKLEFTKEGGEQTIDILTSYKPITIVLGDAYTWLSYSLNDRKLTIKADPSEGGNRSATVIISAFSKKKNRNVEVKLTITQKGLVDASIEPTELYFGVDGGTQPVYVAVGNDTEFTGVSVRDESDTWVTVEKRTSIFNVTVKPNEYGKRIAYVDATFTAKDKDGKAYTVTLPVTILQESKGEETPFDPVDPESFKLPGDTIDLNYLTYSTRCYTENTAGEFFNDQAGMGERCTTTYDGQYIYTLLNTERATIYLKIDMDAVSAPIVDGYVGIDGVVGDEEYVRMRIKDIPIFIPYRDLLRFHASDPSHAYGYHNGDSPLCGYSPNLSSYCSSFSANFVEKWVPVNPDDTNSEYIPVYKTASLGEIKEFWLEFALMKFEDGSYSNDDDDGEVVAEFPNASVISEIKALGMPVYTGSTPPSLQGAYTMTPISLYKSKGANDMLGRGYSFAFSVEDIVKPELMHIKFSDVKDNVTGNMIQVELAQSYSPTSLMGRANRTKFKSPQKITCAVQGEGNKFTICASSKNSNDNVIWMFSGELDGDKIINLHQLQAEHLDNTYNLLNYWAHYHILADEDKVSPWFDWDNEDWSTWYGGSEGYDDDEEYARSRALISPSTSATDAIPWQRYMTTFNPLMKKSH